jgi:SAM-dependent methyltransferase
MNVESWLAALQDRHRARLTSAEFLKAVRALSARYVERRSSLRERSPLDSAGKRAAFAAFYAPLHFLTTDAVVRALGAAAPSRLVDLGCGTGVASAAWALTRPETPALVGVDTHPWALAETGWNWRQLGLRGRVKRENLVQTCERMHGGVRPPLDETGLIAGWSVNELPDPDRERLLGRLLDVARRGAAIVIIEPLARAAAPWWPRWEGAFAGVGGESHDWRLDTELPPMLRAIDEAAGFQREMLTARSLWCHRRPS